MKRKWLPENVTRYRDKTGRWRYRYLKTGQPTHHFHAAPGTPEFLAEYEAAKASQPVKVERYAAGSADALCVAFYGSPGWLSMKPSSQKTYRGIIERWRAQHGSKPIARLEARHVDSWLSAMKDRPAAANNLRKALCACSVCRADGLADPQSG